MKEWNMQKVGLGLGGIISGLYCLTRSMTNSPLFDLKVGALLLQHRARVKLFARRNKDDWSTVDLWNQLLDSNYGRVFLTFIDDDGMTYDYTYGQVDRISNQYANWLIKRGVRKGDGVALFMENKPEFVFLQIASMKVGNILALINNTQKGAPLEHSLKLAAAQVIIAGPENAAPLNDLIREKSEFLSHFCIVGGDNDGNGICVDGEISSMSEDLHHSLPPDNRHCDDTFLYIYTSGTTGFPKASVITHRRFYSSTLISKVLGVTQDDIFYTSLPLYHSAGNFIGLGGAIARSARMVFRRKFSASNFWKDCHDHKCTVIQYIGELCRYLLSYPPSEFDSNHSIRLAIGNGLRPDIWEQFANRFNVHNIGEFYGSTEGNVAMSNLKFKPGAVGYFPQLLNFKKTYSIVQYDVENDEHYRNSNGYCIKCEPGETGEIIGEIVDSDPTTDFKGYTSDTDTNKKIIRDVFKKGDRYFRTGDLMMQDKDGFYYFVDRIGDTFRWKGENVSTSEVEQALTSFPGLLEINVYGAQIPKRDGRAGMAAIVIDSTFNMKNFYDQAMSTLASYAAPLFLRIRPEINTTGTFKHIKTHLRNEGIDIRIIEDPIYVRNDTIKSFIPLTLAILHEIEESVIPIERITPPSL